jgi:hypothetical protein
MIKQVTLLLIVLSIFSGCDHGFSPPPLPPKGTIRGHVTYKGTWPPPSEITGMRFAALPFVPKDPSEILTRFTEIALSDNLPVGAGVTEANFQINDVTANTFVYSGVVQQFGPNLLDIRLVGLYSANGGKFTLEAGGTVNLEIVADFDHLPPFPPSSSK